jgi:ketosteroid isomerase-like protein
MNLLLKNLLIGILLVPFFGCGSKTDLTTKWKKEIYDTEIAFSDMAGEAGLSAAFLHFAADSAVLMRGNKLIQGKDSIRAYFEKNRSSDEKTTLIWKPDFVNVSASGDLGYTYGKYVYTVTDSLGKTTNYNGIFHTVWKKQADGNWRFVWD